MAAADHDALDAAALARRADILPQLVDEHERVSSQLRSINWSKARAAAFVRVDDAGRWFVFADGDQTHGDGFVALIATLARIEPPQAAAYLAGLLDRLGALAA